MGLSPAPAHPDGRRIRCLADICIIVITSLFVAGIIIDRVVPALLFSVAKTRYAAQVRQCEDAKRDADLIESRLVGDAESDMALRKTARVYGFNCVHTDALKNALLGWRS
jgi:hypothetical protein